MINITKTFLITMFVVGVVIVSVYVFVDHFQHVNHTVIFNPH